MKKHIDTRFLAAAGLCLALLAVPPLAVQVQAAQYAAPQARPELPGVMSDEIRLDPVAGALYRYGVQGGINRANNLWDTEIYTTLRGKLKQAATRGLLSDDQLAYLLARVDAGEAQAGPHPVENGSVQVYCYGAEYTGNIQTLSFQMYTVDAFTVEENGNEMYSLDDATSIELMYLPNNGAFLSVGVNDNNLPAADVTPEEQTQAFLTQLDTTLAGEWEPGTAEDKLEYDHTSGVLRAMRYAVGDNSFGLTVMLEPEVYGGLDTLNGIVTGPDGTVSTLGGEYTFF